MNNDGETIDHMSVCTVGECTSWFIFFHVCFSPSPSLLQLSYVLLISRQGKTRLAKWYDSFSSKETVHIMKEAASLVIARPSKMCNFIEWRDKKLVYKRYASLYFVACIAKDDNELITLEQIHLFVEVLDSYFGNVCELDIIFNFHKVRRDQSSLQ